MNNKILTAPKLCVLTQTATDVRPYYREFFKGLDLFFVTFKQKNVDAVDFMPGSTWSEGRNHLWEHVKGRYDYYLFIDDDLAFYCLPTDLPTSLEWLLQKKIGLQERLHIRSISQRLVNGLSYKKADPDRFRKLLYDKLNTYKPAVASVALTLDDAAAFHQLDRYSLHRNHQVRPLGWFDAQISLFSNVGAELLLPYDTSISGWWSSQIPIYVLAHLAFKEKAMNILNIASRNMSTSLYRPGYDGFKDCLEMSEWLSKGILDRDREPINLKDGTFIDQDYAFEFSKTKINPSQSGVESLDTALADLSKSFDLHHPYIYQRHQARVDALDGRSSLNTRESVRG